MYCSDVGNLLMCDYIIPSQCQSPNFKIRQYFFRLFLAIFAKLNPRQNFPLYGIQVTEHKCVVMNVQHCGASVNVGKVVKKDGVTFKLE